MRVRGADRPSSGDDDMAHELDAVAERHVAADDAEGPILTPAPSFAPVLDDRRRMDCHFSHFDSQMRVRRRSRQHGADFGFGHDLAVDLRFAA